MTTPSLRPRPAPTRRYIHQHTDGFIRVTRVSTGTIVTVVKATSVHFDNPREAERFIEEIAQ